MTARRFILFLSLIIYCFSFSQNVKIGSDNSAADPSAILELDGTLGGISVPNLWSFEIDNLLNSLLSLPPAELTEALGMLVYQVDFEKAGLYFFNGSQFERYKPNGMVGTVGGSYTEVYPSSFVFDPPPGFNSPYTPWYSGIGDYDVFFNSGFFKNRPIITLTAENQKIALSDELPIPNVVCTPSFSADCSSDFNSDQVEAVRIESYVQNVCGGSIEIQVLQNGEGFLPPESIPFVDTWPYGTNANGQLWMTTGIGQSPGNPALGDYILQISGGPWGPITDCILQVSDPCVIQDGGGNYGKYYPDVNVFANTYCNNIYHPADQGVVFQQSQPTIRLGKGPFNYFKIFAESSRQWADELAAWIDWNRDGDFDDFGEGLGMIGDPSCTAQGSGSTSLCSGPGQFSCFLGGDCIVPADAELGLTTLRVISAWAAPNLMDEPCRQSIWGETEDYVVEIYDCNIGSVVGIGTEFQYNPVVCFIKEIFKSGLDYTGFKVNCQDINGNPVDTKVHWDATESTYY